MDKLGCAPLHFAFTITFHYISRSSRWAALLIVYLRPRLRTATSITIAQHVLARIFGIICSRVVTESDGISVRTNWQRFEGARSDCQTLAMEGVPFFLESSSWIILFGEKKLAESDIGCCVLVFLGSCLGYSSCDGRVMQHPTGYRMGQRAIELASFWIC